ncbi:hypothetical protein CDCA_CDCA14G3797 [Cyanidium caldarium]|uniref:tRNA-binding domain-containing protein n=1 Tax=Cyanidium caldarium TaxID=2771 RepID=A0AAV9IZN4_CYACA|nr:hypothetical protein CDCA_CDCA14G3797 [Cyanidium caldarium]
MSNGTRNLLFFSTGWSRPFTGPKRSRGLASHSAGTLLGAADATPATTSRNTSFRVERGANDDLVVVVPALPSSPDSPSYRPAYRITYRREGGSNAPPCTSIVHAAPWIPRRADGDAVVRIPIRNCSSGEPVRIAVFCGARSLGERVIHGESHPPTAATSTPVPPAETSTDPITELSRLEIRVGRILSCERHPDADSLYVEQVDIGTSTRTIVSGLVPFQSREQLLERPVVVLCNLKPRAMRGVTSHGMLLCASNAEHTRVEPLQPPPHAQPGDLVTFRGHRANAYVEPGNRASKAFDRVAAGLTTDAEGVARFEDAAFEVVTESGREVCRAETIRNGRVS